VYDSVGDGPWNQLRELDVHIPRRQFDNFNYVNFFDTTTNIPDGDPQAAFAIKALMEIPDQYKRIRELKLIGTVAGRRA
jgi:E3 ubiquitin-protein ligase RGLG